MKRFIKLMFCVAVFGITAYLAQPKEETSELLLENVEALTDNEQKEIHYSSIHLACYETVNYGGQVVVMPTGDFSASCFENDNASDLICHSHPCSSCASN